MTASYRGQGKVAQLRAPEGVKPALGKLTEADKIEIWLVCEALDQTDQRIKQAQQDLLYRLRKEGKIAVNGI